MSLQSLILSLLDGITDPKERSDIASTIFFFANLYETGRINDDQLTHDVIEVVSHALDITHPELLPDEKKKKVSEISRQIIGAIKITTLRRRAIRTRSPVSRSTRQLPSPF